MNRFTKFLAAVTMLISTSVIAQDFQGIATYKSHRKMDIKLDSSQMNSDMHKRMMDMMKKQFEKTYHLSFTKEESLFKEEEQLEAPQRQGMMVVMVETGGSDVMYKNTKEKRYTNQNESFSKLFLIQDKLEDIDWKLGNETKNIGEYTAYKATFTREVEVRESGISVNGDKDLDEEAEPEMEEITITAWYTPEIPVSAGPRNYHGLPGLILEVDDGRGGTLMCSKVVLNPEKSIEIKEPKKGQKINQEKYDAIMEKKMEEMRERRRNSRERRDGNSVEIRIGG
ncbi:GLPGLI family protein [Flavobacteriaceae bacterium S0862]|nr:GLPGLI family protein [Flavobacteriaceae bacterium S0862]